VYLFVQEDPEFRRDGINILSDLKISYLQAILGAQISAKTVEGEEPLTIPAGTQPGTILTLENHGVPRLGNPVSRGDHLITVVIEIPNRVAPEERELLEQLAQIRGDRASKGSGVEGFLGGLFGGR
jgi:molecular chaperone DnaJ